MTIILLPFYIGAVVVLYGSGAGYVAWAAFIAIGGFIGLCALATD